MSKKIKTLFIESSFFRLVKYLATPIFGKIYRKFRDKKPFFFISKTFIKPKTIKKNKQSFKNIFENFNEILVILHPDWLGIKSSSRSFFSEDQMLYLDGTERLDELKLLVKELKKSPIKKAIFQGFPPGYETLVRLIKSEIEYFELYIIYHGSFFQMHDSFEQSCLKKILLLNKEGLIKKIGFVKKGMDQTLSKLGYSTGFIKNFVPETLTKTAAPDEFIKIGIIGNGYNIRKLPFVQIAACKGIPNAKINIIGSSPLIRSFCDLMELNVNLTEGLSQEKMPDFLKKNDVNLYVTLSECAPMVPLESLALGVPCIFGPNNHYFEDNIYLKSRLISEIPDSEINIREKILVTLKERDKILLAYKDYTKSYNLEAKKSMEDFLS